MDLNLTQEQQLIRDAARDFLGRECPSAHVRAMENDVNGYSSALWQSMAELGWMGLALPEQYGGAGSGFLELCLLVEELGRFRMPSPFLATTALCALPIAAFGNSRQRSTILPAIAAGKQILSYAESEANGEWNPSGIVLAAKARGSDYVLSGEKLFVPYATATHMLLVAARTGGQGASGITLFLVDTASPGIACESLPTVACDHQARARSRRA